MTVKLAILLLLSAEAILAQTSYVPPTKILKRKGHQIGISGEYFSTSKKVDDSGKKVEFADGESFRRIQGEAAGYYGVSNDFQVGLGVRYRSNEATLVNNASEEFTSTSSGIQSSFVNFMYAFKPVEQLQYTLEGTFRFVPYTNEENNTDVEKMILGDDGHEASAGLGVTYHFKNSYFLTGRAGYRRPGREISDEVYWQLEGAKSWKRFALVAGVDGVSSLNKDPYEDTPTERPTYSTANTNLYNGSNREWIAPYAGLNVAVGKHWRVDLRASHGILGQSTDLGTTFGIQLVRRVDRDTSKIVDATFKTYDLEATITKISPKKGYVIVDKGLTGGVQKGMKFDFFEFDYLGGNVLVAKGSVIQSKADTAVVKITQRYNSKAEIKEGLVGRASF